MYERLELTPRPSSWVSDWLNVSHLILHHTATPNDDRGGEYWWNQVFWWHCFGESEYKRPWGDIGYHYGIKDTLLLEGRIGGDAAVGAHTYHYNTNSIGIALIGSYETEEISDESEWCLVQLLAHLCIKWGIDPVGQAWIQGRFMPTIAGHRDYMTTECPGNAFYRRLNVIRSEVAALVKVWTKNDTD